MMHQPQPTHFADDRIAGGIVVGLACLYMVLMLLAMLGVSLLIGMTAEASLAERNTIKGLMAILTISQVLMGAVNVVVGIGIARSARWAFITGLVFNILISLSNVAITLAFDDMATLATIMIAVYCFLRLSGRIGPKPA